MNDFGIAGCKEFPERAWIGGRFADRLPMMDGGVTGIPDDLIHCESGLIR
jgi:hypothetical protein